MLVLAPTLVHFLKAPDLGLGLQAGGRHLNPIFIQLKANPLITEVRMIGQYDTIPRFTADFG